jgi:hypothetical protein
MEFSPKRIAELAHDITEEGVEAWLEPDKAGTPNQDYSCNW